MRFNRRIEHHEQIYGTVAEFVQPDIDGPARVEDVPSVLVLGHERFQGLQNDIPGLFDVCSVADAHGYLEQFVVPSAVQVLEFLGEQFGVGDGDDGTVLVFYLRGLVTHALDDAADAVAGDLVAHADASGHQLDAVEEVVDQVLERKADTGGETGRDGGERSRRNMQDGEGDNQVQQPSQQGKERVGQAQVHVRLLEGDGSDTSLLDDAAQFDYAEQGLHQIDYVSENEEESDDEQQVGQGQETVSVPTDERHPQQVRPGQGQLIGAGGEQDAQRERDECRERNNDHAEQVVQPGHFDERILVIQRHLRILLVVTRFPPDHLVLIITLHQVVKRGDGVKEGQLEGPEGEQEHADHRVAGQGQDARYGHHAHGYPHVTAVRRTDLRPASDVYDALPDDEQQQGRREDERNRAGRQEDGAHEDARERQ